MLIVLWAIVVVQWLHIAMAMLWVGGSVAFEVLVTPATAALPLPARRRLGLQLGTRVGRFFAVVGAGTMLLGIVRGTLLGPIRSGSALATPYGTTWLAALVITIGVAMLGALAIGPAAERLYREDRLWVPTRDGQGSAALAAATSRLGLLGAVQIGGFALALACMVLMSVGL